MYSGDFASTFDTDFIETLSLDDDYDSYYEEKTKELESLNEEQQQTASVELYGSWNEALENDIVTKQAALTKIEDSTEKALIEEIVATAAEKLQACGLDVFEIVKKGDPREVLVEEADRLRSDCIFLGARALRRRDRFLLGRVSTAVATRAQCSVEVVRPRQSIEQEGRA